jgi:hypothetical protein
MFNARASSGKYWRCTAIGLLHNQALRVTVFASLIGFETARVRARLNRVGWQFFLVRLRKTVCSKDLPFQRFCRYVFGMAASALKSLARLEV